MTAPLRALLVDDEWPALQRLQQLLADHGGVEVVAQASSVNEAIAQLQHQAVDLVFLDLRMPRAGLTARDRAHCERGSARDPMGESSSRDDNPFQPRWAG